MSSSTLKLVAACTVWGLIVVVGFWHFDFSYLRPVTGQASAEGIRVKNRQVPEQLASGTGFVQTWAKGKITLINFWNPNCECSIQNEPVVRGIWTRFSPAGLRIITVIEISGMSVESAMKAWQSQHVHSTAVVPDMDGKLARSLGVWATPGAMVVNGSGHVVYKGGYNVARFCHDPTTSWVPQAIEATMEGKQPAHPSSPFFGCCVPG